MSSRTKKSSLNIISNISLFSLSTIMTFVVRTIFVKVLGENYLGLSSLYTNILSMLNLTELGLTTAVGFSLYRYLEDKKYSEISCLLTYYKKLYRNIGIIILVLGLIVTPNLNIFIKDNNILNYQYFFILYLSDTVLSYFICYKDILLESDQRNYKALKIKSLSMFLLYSFEIIALLVFKSFFAYMIAFVVLNNIGKLLLNIYISKKYVNIDFNCSKKIDYKEQKKLKKNIKAMLFHRIGDYLVNGTDNIIISRMIGIVTVGIYSNYLSLISIIKSLISTIYTAIVSSLGNLIVKENTETQERVFKISEFISFFFGGLFTIVFYNCVNIFVEIWIGQKYLLSQPIVLVICLNFYLYCSLLPIESFKTAAGLYDVDKYIALLQAIINLIASIILAKYFGLIGVLIGTAISYIVTVSWTKPYMIYKHIFKKSVFEYYCRQIKNLLLMIFAFLLSNNLIEIVTQKSLVLTLILNATLSIMIFLVLLFILYRKNDQFIYLKNSIKNKLFN